MSILIGIASLKPFGDYIKPILLILVIIFLHYYFCIRKEKNKYLYVGNTNLFVLIAFSITYFIISLYYFQNTVEISIACLSAYFIGTMIITLSKKREKDIIKYIYAIAIGFFIHAMLNYITNLQPETRNTIDIWTKNPKSASLQATMLTILMGTCFYSLVCVEKIQYKIILAICILFALSYDMILATRTLIIISIIAFIISWVFFIILNKDKKYLKQSFKILGICLIIILLVYFTNFMELREKIQESNILNRINKPETINADKSRIETFFLSIKNVFQYPMGRK